MHKINVRENRRNYQEWTIHIHWQHWTHKTQDEDKKKHKYITQKVKRMTNTDPTTNGGVSM